MKIGFRTVLLWAGVLSAVSNPCALAHTDVTVAEARDLIASTSDLTVVDVREQYEYCDVRGHIPGALNYPWSSGVLRSRYEELPADGPVLVVCRSGGRSNAAASFLDSMGFSEVYDMLRGMNAWQWETAPCKYSGGSGMADDPHQIATAADLINLGETPEDYDKHFILTDDIDLYPNLPGRQVFDKAVIGSFAGVFDGNGHVISRLTVRGVNSLGLFGILDSGARISNLGLVAVDVDGEAGIGSLVGTNNGSITNSYGTGMVNGNLEVGGLAGANGLGSITASHSSSEVIGGEEVGGLVGINLGSISASSSTGTVTGNKHVGGLVGFMSRGGITASHSTGTVIGDHYVGGLVGDNYGDITTSYSTATVSSAAKLSAEGASFVGHVGGLAGSNAGSIAASYSLGEVNGPANVGGLAGSSGGSIANSYSTGSVNGYENVGGLVGISHGSIALSYST
ncbi:MAG: rhodanese-like domain-containing protein, partial [Planctomycetota bacterium]